jgi:hypothetical protein
MAPLQTPRLPQSNLRLPRLRLARPRGSGSVELDEARPIVKGDQLVIPPFMPEREFLQQLVLEQGHHVTAVGATQSGKTTLITRWVLPRRSYTVVLATKRRDPSLYPRLKANGFVMTDDPELNAGENPKVIYRPGLKLKGTSVKDAKILQRDGFERVLTNVIEEGSWAVYGDEIRYLANDLKLTAELEQLWLQGATELVTMIVSTQRPVAIPVVAFESAWHLFLFRTTDVRNIERIAEFEGANEKLLRWLLPRLEEHEVLYIETRTGRMVRTKVRL